MEKALPEASVHYIYLFNNVEQWYIMNTMKNPMKAQLKQVAAAHKVDLNRYQVTDLPKLTSLAIDAVIAQFKQARGKQLLVTNHVAPDVARRLHKARVQFLDAVGNMYINDGPRYVFVTGNAAPAQKKKESAIEKTRSMLHPSECIGAGPSHRTVRCRLADRVSLATASPLFL